MKSSQTFPHHCLTCGDPTTTDGTLHVWSGRLGLPERPYDHPANPDSTSANQATEAVAAR